MMMTILDRITDMIKDVEGDRFRDFIAPSVPLKRMNKPIDVLPLLETGFFVIAETKKGSPSKGIIRQDYDPAALAKDYEQAGASAISVITEEYFFFGSKQHLKLVKETVNLPVLRKDFLVHPCQVYESYDLGADLVLLIAACLTDDELSSLYRFTLSLGMNALIEVHNKEELDRVLVLEPKPRLIGINNRDLKTFTISLEASFQLKPFIPEDIFVISESGIDAHAHIQALKEAGFAGALIGESLLKQKNTRRALTRLLGSE
jgi:indole-3-glycerol phosphate synthase